MKNNQSISTLILITSAIFTTFIFSIVDFKNDNVSSPKFGRFLAGISIGQKHEVNLCPILKTDSSNFSSQVNPTGNPIGGGICYTRIIRQNQADYVVTDKAALLTALAQATTGQTVFIPGNITINLNGSKNIAIPSGVTLASDRGFNGSEGALLTSTDLWPENEMSALFVTGGVGVRITGLRMQGPNPDVWDHETARGFANAIRSLHANLEVDNCELYAWDKWAVWLFIQNGAYIHHNDIHHITRAGYGYGIWAGGSGSETNASCIVEANVLDACRTCFDSSAHANSEEIRYNVIMRRQFYKNISRHSHSQSATNSLNIYGGKNTRMHHNLFFSGQQHFTFPIPDLSTDFVEVDHNWFVRSENNASAPYGVMGQYNADQETYSNMSSHDNWFDGTNRNEPIANFTQNALSGTAPLTVNFDASPSYDRDGGQIMKYTWSFGDGDYDGNQANGKTVSHTFTQPGQYSVKLVASNAYGVPSNSFIKQITVLPNNSQGKYVLSAWVKDSYPGTLTGRYKKQVILDSTSSNPIVVWENDVAGNQGWEHIVVPLDQYVTTNSQHRISVRMVSPNGVTNPAQEIVEIFVWIDDVWISNSSIWNTSFEDNVYPPWNQAFNIPTGSPTGVSSACNGEEARSGDRSYRFRIPLGATGVLPNTWGEVYQYVTFKPVVGVVTQDTKVD